MSSDRPAPWVSLVLYAAVLVAGTYASVTGLGHTEPLLMLAILAALVGIDLTPMHRIVALVLRTGLIVAISLVDGTGTARILFILLPFTAYFAFGRVVSIALGVACLGLAVATTPGWYVNLDQVSDLVMFTVGLVLTITMAAVAAEERRLRNEVADLSATAERTRMARDIHDGLGHHLTSIVIQLEQAKAFRTLDAGKADQAIADAYQSAKRALEDVRHSVRALHTPFGLAHALRELVAGQADVTMKLTGTEHGYSTQALTALFRAAQEGITNSRRHANASQITVAVDLSASRAVLTVADDGRGFTGEEGFGLLGMRERVRLAGGQVDISKSPDGGAKLTVAIPK